jgi:hypothetical protein
VPTSQPAGVNRTFVVTNESNAAWPAGPPPFRVISATTTSMLLYVDPYEPRPGDNLTAEDITIGYNYYVAPLDTARDQLWRFPRTNFWWRFDRDLAPYISTLDTSSCSLGSSCSVTLRWGIPQGRGHGVSNVSAGGASAASFSFVSGTTTAVCSSPTVVNSSISSWTSYNETVTCTLPASTPASTYTLWVCFNTTKYGCGYKPAALELAAAVTALSPSSGSGAGGTTVTISGSGFASNTAEVSVRFGNSSCNVTAASFSSITCITGAMPAGGFGPYQLAITPSSGAPEASPAGLTFTFDQALTPALTSVTPTRGSTEAGTLLTITGSGFTAAAGQYSILLGSLACADVTVVNSSALQCTTQKDNGTVPQGVLQLKVGPRHRSWQAHRCCCTLRPTRLPDAPAASGCTMRRPLPAARCSCCKRLHHAPATASCQPSRAAPMQCSPPGTHSRSRRDRLMT